jgi:hypothetical protein
MDTATLESHVFNLLASKASLETAIADSAGDTTALEADLADVKEDLDLACADARATCPTEGTSGSSVEDLSEGLPIETIALIAIVVVIAALLGLLFTRRGSNGSDDNWNAATVPAHDVVANSMYGGAQAIFQAPAPVIPQAPAGGPPLPPGGLPAGWSMEQWVYYGQQYLDDQR